MSEQKTYKPRIEVFVTKNHKLRVKVADTLDTPGFEVTIRGKEWQTGKGHQYKERIKIKAQNLLLSLIAEIDNI